MSQAEIAGGNITASSAFPSKGRRIRDFELISALGGHVRTSDYRGRANLVLIVTDDRTATTKLLSGAARRYTQLREQECEVLAVVQRSREQAAEMKRQMQLPYPVLADEDGCIHREVGAIDAQEHAAAAVYITDRFGEVFGAYRTRDRQSLPDVADIVNWLEFINRQCPECEPPEWPV